MAGYFVLDEKSVAGDSNIVTPWQQSAMVSIKTASVRPQYESKVVMLARSIHESHGRSSNSQQILLITSTLPASKRVLTPLEW